MILFPPVKFDANEWFFIAALLIFVPLFLLPKRLSPVTLIAIWVFNCCLAQTADYSIAFEPFDLYDINDRMELEYFDFLLYYFTYPPVAVYVLYMYDYWRPTKWKLALYIGACALTTMMLEWLSVTQWHVFTYKGWNVGYSGIVYIFVYWLNIRVFIFVQKYLPRGVR